MPKVVDITPTGATAGSLADNRDALNERQREAFGADLALSPQTPQAQWSGIGALALAEVGEATVRAALFGSSVDHAEGTFLDAHGSLLDIQRRIATRSRVTATLTGVAGTGVPAGSRARTATGDEFRTLTVAVLSPEGITVDMEAVETGPVPAAANALTTIVTVIAGWETITNTAAATLGVDRETDAEFRARYLVATAHSSIGPVSALEAAIDETLAGKQRVLENPENTDRILQEWTVGSHSILVVSEAGSDNDVRRAVENHRGMGVGTMTAIRAGTHTDSDLAPISNGTVNWNGRDYTGLDISSDTTGPARAATLTALLASDEVPPTIAFINGQYVAQFRWRPDRTPNFGDNSVTTGFGFDPDSSTYPAGPFIRPTERALAVAFTMTRRTGFPGNGLDQARTAVLERVKLYQIGEELWLNDLLCEVEKIPGTRVTGMTVTAAGAAVSGVAVPADNLWTLALDALTITVV